MLYLEGNEDGIGIGFYLCEYDGATCFQNDDNRLVAHRFLRLCYQHHIVTVIGLDSLALETAVRGLLHRITTSDADSTGILCRIVFILQTERQIAIAAFLHIVVAESEACAGLFDNTDGEVGFAGIIHHLEVLPYEGEVNRLDGLFLRDAAPCTRDGWEVALGHIYLLAILNGQHMVIVVLQHDDGFELGLITLLHELRIAYDLLCLGRIEVRILEKAHTEYIQQQATGREFKSLSGILLTKLLAPHLVSLHHRTDRIITTKLIDASL